MEALEVDGRRGAEQVAELTKQLEGSRVQLEQSTAAAGEATARVEQLESAVAEERRRSEVREKEQAAAQAEERARQSAQAGAKGQREAELERQISELEASVDLAQEAAMQTDAELNAERQRSAALKEKVCSLEVQLSTCHAETTAGAVQATNQTPCMQGETTVEASNSDHAEADADVIEGEPLLAKQIGKPLDAEEKPRVADVGGQRVKELQSRVAELEVQNLALNRRLDARPIVYQFSPLGDEGEEEEADASVEVVEDGGVAASGSDGVGWQTRARNSVSWCKRQLGRGFRACRRQPCTKSVERPLKTFTKILLRRPLLLWLFYAHLLMLYVVEIWRQSLSRPRGQDPVARIENKMQAITMGSTGGG